MSTTENLKHAFAGESQANRKYLAYARKADKDGFPQIARLFRAAAEAETIHALGHFNALEAVKSTAENLKDAIKGETYEYTEMYPPMLAAALAENHRAKLMFGYAVKAEEVHARLYTAALAALEAGKDLDGLEVYVCPVCGNLELGVPTDKCSVCGLAADRFQKVA
ncbi:MAG TPA: rubrerythrin family protein [Polyangia bacterium]|jgi:rubrerythrin